MVKTHERHTERATAEEIAEVERQLWEFAKRIDPETVPEAKLRPGAFLYRIHRTWHSLGRGTGGLASRSFRALRDELLARDPPVRNLQPKLYGNTALSYAEAEQLIDVILDTWHLERNRNGKWQAKPLTRLNKKKIADGRDLETIRENLLHTLFRGDDHIILEEPVGVAPEVFFEERGRSSLALILPTKSETVAHLSPSNAYGGFSTGLSRFFDAAKVRVANDQEAPLLIWILKLGVIRDNAEFHQAYHAIAMHSACLTNWYLRLNRIRGSKQKEIDNYWKMINQHSAFVIHGLPDQEGAIDDALRNQNLEIDEELAELDTGFLLPNSLPIVLGNHKQVRRHHEHRFGLTVSVEKSMNTEDLAGDKLAYWLFPDQPKSDLMETAETTGLPVFGADMSPGVDFDRAYEAVYRAVTYKLGLADDKRSREYFETLSQMGWALNTISELQKKLLIPSK